MRLFTLILLIGVLIEAAVSGTLIARQLWRAEPVLPQVEWDDPLVADEFQELAGAAAHGDSADWQHLAEALLGQGFYSYAEIAFRQALAEDPQNQAARFGLAFSLERTGRTQASSHEYEQLVRYRTVPGSIGERAIRSQYAIGRNALRDEQPQIAAAAFRVISTELSAQFQLNKLQIRSGKADDALPEIEAIIRNLPTSLEFRFLQYRAAEALNLQDEAFEAADALERSTAQIPIHFNTQYVGPFHARLGLERLVRDYNRLIVNKDMDKLAEVLKEILTHVRGRRSPFTKVALTSMLEVELQRRNPQQMLQLVQELEDFGEWNADVMQLKGAAFAYQGKMDEAIALWRRAARMSPNVQLSLRMAEYYEHENETAQRDECLAQSYLLGAMGAYRENHPDQALELVNRSLAANARDAQAWFYKAETLRVLGEEDEALLAYQQCLKFNPNHGRAILQLQRLQAEKS